MENSCNPFRTNFCDTIVRCIIARSEQSKDVARDLKDESRNQRYRETTRLETGSHVNRSNAGSWFFRYRDMAPSMIDDNFTRYKGSRGALLDAARYIRDSSLTRFLNLLSTNKSRGSNSNTRHDTLRATHTPTATFEINCDHRSTRPTYSVDRKSTSSNEPS